MTNPDGYQSPDGVGSGGDPSGWSGIASLLGGFYDTTISSQTAKKNTERTIEAQRAEAEKAYQRQVEMWHMQNAYNSPAEQMKRFGAAGLNPHLIYGKGNEGNASKFPEYQAPNLQYRYEAPQYGAASASAIQQLMQVGSWMQNMRLSEQELSSKTTGAEAAQEMLDFMRAANPKKLSELDNRLSLYPYQSSMSRNLAEKSLIGVGDMLEEFRYKWGSEFTPEFGDYTPARGGGMKWQDALKKIAERKLVEAKASWTDFNITDPQSLMEMVFKGVMSMAGQTMRVNPKGRNAPTIKMIGKGQRGRWSAQSRRWIP